MELRSFSRKAMALSLLTLLCVGCGGAHVSRVRKEVAGGRLRTGTRLVVAPADTAKTKFEGDGADSLQAVLTARKTLAERLAPQVAEALHQKGFRTDVLASASTRAPAGALTVHLRVKECNWGSNAARVLVGFGAGAAWMLTDVRVTNGKTTVAEFTVDANSGAESGWTSLGDWTPLFMEWTARQVALQLSGTTEEDADDDDVEEGEEAPDAD